MIKEILHYIYNILKRNLRITKRVSFNEIVLVHNYPKEIYVRKITASVYKKVISGNFIEKNDSFYEILPVNSCSGEYIHIRKLKEAYDYYYELGTGNLCKKKFVKVSKKIYKLTC